MTGKVVYRCPAFCAPLLSKNEAEELAEASGDLGVDPSSDSFAQRRKNIGFVICISGTWFQINHDYFNQAQDYNDFSGGYRRYYRQLPSAFIQSDVSQKLLNRFQKIYSIPDGKLVLVQVQSSVVSPDDEGQCLTGQGIHSDGADRAMLACLKRENVFGARNAVFFDSLGKQMVVPPTTLEEGEVLFWEDNAVYHYVEPAQLLDDSHSGERTVLIAHYPAEHYISGHSNLNNKLPPSGLHPPYMMERSKVSGPVQNVFPSKLEKHFETASLSSEIVSETSSTR